LNAFSSPISYSHGEVTLAGYTLARNTQIPTCDFNVVFVFFCLGFPSFGFSSYVSSVPREKYEASDIERYNIEVCVSRKEEIPICFWSFHGRGRGNNRVA